MYSFGLSTTYWEAALRYVLITPYPSLQSALTILGSVAGVSAGLSMATLASSEVSLQRSPTPQVFRWSMRICHFLGPSVGRSGKWDTTLLVRNTDRFLQSDDWGVTIAPSRALSGYLWKFRVSEEVPVLPSLCSLRNFFGVCRGHRIYVFTGGEREI